MPRCLKTRQSRETVSRFFPISKRPPPLPAAECQQPLIRSKYFQPASKPHPDFDEAAASANFKCIFERVFYSKPILIQELLCNSPWDLLVAVILLNKTNARAALPMYWYLKSIWSTPEELASADTNTLIETLSSLGLQSTRAGILIKMSQMWIKSPPSPFIFHRSRVIVKGYPQTPISHLPGCGKYALDSYRIFCSGRDEWKNVTPDDKELIKYLKWRWAVEEFKRWDPVGGVLGGITREDLESLPEILRMPAISTSIELQLMHFERPHDADVS